MNSIPQVQIGRGQHPASGSCQRWRRGRQLWRRPSDGIFTPDTHAVTPIREGVAAEFIRDHHYSATMPTTRLCYGLTTKDDRLHCGHVVDGQRLVGVAVLSVPMRAAVLTRVFPTLEPSMHRRRASTGRYRTAFLLRVDRTPRPPLHPQASPGAAKLSSSVRSGRLDP
jgi:hypothetical protein